ncbi:MAG: hypothetical protein MUD10_01115 [Candidatus Pacebacteria bacterium]|nr:hypothetical protein [Candidatus Paceibacterota bacterium]
MSTVFTYIHTNPISLIDSGWKENGTKDGDAAKEFLLNYRWSSYLDYVGKRNFPSVSDREYILKIIGNSENAKKYIEDWIARKQK